MLRTEQLGRLSPQELAEFYDTLTPTAWNTLRQEIRLERAVVGELRAHSFRGAAAELWDHTDGEVLLSGPAGTGKSLAALKRVMDLAVQHPGMRALVVRKTATSLTSSALVTWKQRVATRALASGAISFYGGSAEEPAQYRFWNGSVMLLAGMDKGEKIMSTEFDLIFVQEAIELTEDDWERLTTRLRNGVLPAMQIIGDTNPSVDTHWLKARCDRGQTVMLRSHHEDNPALYTDDGERTEEGHRYLELVLGNLTGVRRQRLLDGDWVSAEGMVYPEWDASLHLVDRFDVPDAWARWLVVDFGYSNPFVAQWWAMDPDGRLVMFREIYHTGRLVEDHARQILALTRDIPEDLDPMTTDTAVLRRLEWAESPPQAIICDHDAEDRATLERHLGTSTRAARKSVLDGIQRVSERLRGSGGRPRLLVMRDSLVELDHHLLEAAKPTCTAEELPGYVWDQAAKLRGKEQPLKVDDHGADCTRYMVAEVDLVPQGRVRFL